MAMEPLARSALLPHSQKRTQDDEDPLLPPLPHSYCDPRFLLLPSSPSSSSPSSSPRDLAIHVYVELAQLHRHRLIPYLPRIMCSVMENLTCSPRVHSACAQVVVSLALNTIDFSQNPSTNEETLRSLCLPLLPSISSQNLNLSSGSASCLKALIETEKWRFFAPLDLQELVCSIALAALSAHDHHLRPCSVSLICLMRSLAEFSSNVVIQGFGARLLSVGMEILQFSASSCSSSRKIKKLAAELIESILRIVDADLLDLDLSPIYGVLEGHRGDGFFLDESSSMRNRSRKSFCSPSIAKSSASLLQPSKKHNVSSELSMDSSCLRTPHQQFDVDKKKKKKKKTKQLSLEMFPDKENLLTPPSFYGIYPLQGRISNTSASMPMKISHNEAPLLSLSPISGHGLDIASFFPHGEEEDDAFFLSSVRQCFIDSHGGHDDGDSKQGKTSTLSKSSMASLKDQQSSLSEDDCESVISFESGSLPQVNIKSPDERLQFYLKDQEQEDENLLASNWENDGSVDFDFELSGDLDFSPFDETLQESWMSSGHECWTMDIISDASPIRSETSDLNRVSKYDRGLSMKSQASGVSPQSSCSRYSESKYGQVNSPEDYDDNVVEVVNPLDTLTSFTECLDEKGSSTGIVSPISKQITSDDPLSRYSECSDEEGSSEVKSCFPKDKVVSSRSCSGSPHHNQNSEVGSVVSFNRKRLQGDSEQTRIVYKSTTTRRTSFAQLLNRSSKHMFVLALSLFLIYVVGIFMYITPIAYTSNGQALVPT